MPQSIANLDIEDVELDSDPINTNVEMVMANGMANV